MREPRSIRLVYDGHCPFCVGASRWLAATGLLQSEETAPFQAFEGAEADGLLEAGIRDRLVLLDLETGRIDGGVRALIHLLAETGHRRWAGLLSLAPVRALLDGLYGTISANRRTLARPPRGQVACACDPQPTVRDRGKLVLLLPIALTVVWGIRATSAARRRPRTRRRPRSA